MKTRDTHGAFGDIIIGLSWLDVLRLIIGGRVAVSHRSIIIKRGTP